MNVGRQSWGGVAPVRSNYTKVAISTHLGILTMTLIIMHVIASRCAQIFVCIATITLTNLHNQRPFIAACSYKVRFILDMH